MKFSHLQYLSLCLLVMPQAFTQTRVDLANQSRGIDFSAAPATKPSKTGTALPATCSIGETFFKTNAAPGKNLYACTASNSWTPLSSAVDVPNVTGNAGKLMSTDGSNTTWSTPDGDVSGSVSGLTVNKIQGYSVSSSTPQNGDVLTWNNVLSEWQPSTGLVSTYFAGPGIAIAGSSLAVDTATVPQYSVGSGAPLLTCDAGRDIYTDTTNGDLYFCNLTNTWRLLSRSGHQHAATDVSTGTLNLSRGGTNQSSWVAGRCVQIAADGTRLESAAAACGPRSSIGSGAPAMSCTAGQDLYTDTATSNLYFCGQTNSWQLLSRSNHTHSASDLSSGTLPLSRGGTNQTSFIGGRCVQVSSNGTTLESTSGPCGGSGTAAATVTDLLTTASSSPYTFPAGVKYFNVFFCAGGGGGAGSLTTSSGGGGGGGGCEDGVIYLNGTNTMTFTVGAGGNGGLAGQNGASGGATIMTVGGFTYTVNPGSGGSANGSSGAGGRGYPLGVVSGTTLALAATNASRRDQGGPGGSGRNSPSAPRDAGAGICVGGSGGAYNTSNLGNAVSAYYPPNGSSATAGAGVSGAPTAGASGTTCNGGGGGGTDTSLTTAGGAGGSGYIRISYTY